MKLPPPKSKQAGSTGAFALIDEAVHLLRHQPGLLLEYYLGSLPFIMGLLYFINDMSRNAFYAERCAEASLGLAVLFIWMKTWQTCFVNSVYNRLKNQTSVLSGWRKKLRVAGTQTIIQTTGIIILPIAALLCIPFVWCYTLYQNALVLDDGNRIQTAPLIRQAAEQAGLWPKQNYIMLLTFCLMGLVVLVNCLIMMFLLPLLLKKILGIETMFTLSGSHLANTTVWAAAFSLTWLAIDPVIKTSYTLRCFYGISLKTGEDLKAELDSLTKSAALLGVFLILGLIGGAVQASAQPDTYPSLTASSAIRVSPEILNNSINQVLERRIFTWRMPRIQTEKPQKNSGFLFSVMRQIGRFIKKTVIFIRDIMYKIDSWLQQKKIQRQEAINRSAGDSSPRLKWFESVHTIVYILVFVFSLVLLIFLIKFLKRNQGDIVSDAVLVGSRTVNVAEESVSAEALPTDQWQAMAEDLMRQGNYVLAVRALFMSALSLLAEHNFITLARHKSNREYSVELERRSRGWQLLTDLFIIQTAHFERIWYGLRQVNPQDFHIYRETYQQFIQCLNEPRTLRAG